MKTFELTDQIVEQKVERCARLKRMNEPFIPERELIRDLLDGGEQGLARILGHKNVDDHFDLPVYNMLDKANQKLGQKLGPYPMVKIDPPAHMDSDRVKEYAEKRERIVASWDRAGKLASKLPYQGRWLPGYGFVFWTLHQSRDFNGDPFPKPRLRDPFSVYPGQFDVGESPSEVAVIEMWEPHELAKRFPDHADRILEDEDGKSQYEGNGHERIAGGGFLLNGAEPSATGQVSGKKLEVYEYWDNQGTWFLVPSKGLLLAYVPNPLDSGPAFAFGCRVSFNRLIGQYQHVVGLMIAITKMNVMLLMAAEEAVHAETNIYGETLDGEYVRGHRAVNELMHGSKVEKMNQRIPYEVFQQVGILEKMLRNGASYPETDDGSSPISFVTGQGIAELNASLDEEVGEYQGIIRDVLETLDRKRLEWADKLYNGRSMTLHGHTSTGMHVEKYKPATHIAGNYLTQRIHGIMAGWDEPNKIATGANLVGMGAISLQDFRENISGLHDLPKIEKRVRGEKAEGVMFELMLGRAAQGDPLMAEAAVELLPEGEMKTMFIEKILEPMRQQMKAQQQQAQAQQLGSPRQQRPDVQTVMQRLMSGEGGGQADLGVQNVGVV